MGELIPMSDKKTQKKRVISNRCDACEKDLLPVCCLISMLTAVFVTLIFSIAFTGVLTINRSSSYSGAFAASTASDVEPDNFGFTTLDSAAVLDMVYLSKCEGLILVTGNNAAENDDLANKIMNEDTDATIYHYSIVDNGTKTDEYVKALLVGNNVDGAPTLLYVRDGVVYDRLDDVHSEAVISTFIAKYK